MARFDKSNMTAAVEVCARLHPSLNASQVIDCANGSQGTQLLLGMGIFSKQAQSDLNYVPWIVVNGKQTKEIRSAAEKDLNKYLCDNFKLSACSPQNTSQ